MYIATRSTLISGLIFIGIFLGGLYWTQLNQTVQENKHNILLRDIAITQASALERRLSQSLAATYILAQEVKRSQGKITDFESYADEILASIGGISNLQLAPDGVITRIHPLFGNEKAIGHNILRDDRRRQEAQLAVEEKRLTLAGPFPLVQGGIAVIGRNPVFLLKEGVEQFWGFTSALIFLDVLLSVTDLDDLESKGYSYQLSRIHPDTGKAEVFASSKSSLLRQYHSQVINVPNSQWALSISYPYTYQANFGYVASFVLALAVAWLLYNILLQPEKLRLKVEEKTHQLKTLAFHDQLTGLANRLLLNEQLEQEIQRLLRNNLQAALLYIDLDDFKRINDSMGHETGDQLLQVISERFLVNMRKQDIVARLGGDEFAILLLDTDSIEHVKKTADNFIDLVEMPALLNDREVIVSATIGIAMIPGDGQDVGSLLRSADLAMYAAKKSGKHHSQFFNQKMQETASRNLMLEHDLRKAINTEEMFLQYQPLVCLFEREVMGFEALIRWQHPTLGLLPPVQFIPVAEDTGLVIPMGYWVIREACHMIRQRNQQSLTAAKFSVNLAPQQFSDVTLVERIQKILLETGAQAKLLELEITETALMSNIANAVNTLKQLRELGISIAIDDFGTGYSSLSYIKDLPVDTLKIDRNFITGVADKNSGDQKIVEAILAMASKLQLKVVAEGIETAEQLAFLESIHCEFGQGYLFSPPLPAEQMLTYPVKLDKSWPIGGLLNTIQVI